jgi:acyl-CoA synthetase (NDP forming)
MDQSEHSTKRTEARANLRRMFEPRSVAVIGASAKEDKAGYQAVKAFRSFKGAVHPINPQGGTILGFPVLKNIAEVGGAIDLVVLAVPPKACVSALAEVVAAGCAGSLIVSGGFSETGPEGAALQNQLAKALEGGATRLLGPNSSGFINPHSGCVASFVPGLERLRRGSVAIIAQSGGVNLTLAFLLQNRGVGVSLAVGLGNALDISTVDVLDYALEDPNTKAIILHLEGIADGRALYESVRRTSVKKPVVALFAGRSDIGAFAQSHTGRMLGSYERKRAMLRQAGAVVVDTSDEAADAAWVLSTSRLAPTADPGVALITGQAGPALLIADILNGDGVRLSKLSASARAKIGTLLPPMTYLENPIDTGRPGPQFPEIVSTVTGDDDVALTAIFAIQEPAALDPNAVVAAARGAPILMGTAGIDVDVRSVADEIGPLGCAYISSPERMAKAVSFLIRDARLRSRPDETRSGLLGKAHPIALAAFDEASAKDLLATHGIASPKRLVCASHGEAAEFLRGVDGKVVVKVLSTEIHHKTEVGGVFVGVRSESELEVALTKIDAIPTRSPKRYLLEEMADPGVEFIIGGVRDETFGPVVMLGIGGIIAEALKDSSTRLAPVGMADALEMMDELRGRTLLDGFRGGPIVDRISLANVIRTMGELLLVYPQIKEIEINPLRATASGLVALDAIILV